MKNIILVLVTAIIGLSAFAQDLPVAGQQKLIGCFEVTDQSQPPASIMYFEVLLSNVDAVEGAVVLVLDPATGQPLAGDDLVVSSMIFNGAEVSFNATAASSELVGIQVTSQYVGVQTYTDEQGQEITVPVYSGSASIAGPDGSEILALVCSVDYLN
jgi:hypothetical protein